MSNHFMFIGFIIFMSCLLFLCATVVWFVCWGVARLYHHAMPFAPFAYVGLGIVVLFLVIMLYGYCFGRFQLRVQQTTYTSDKVPAAFDGYKIVHISDLHLSSMADSPEFLQRVIDSINAQQPDFICITGDLVGFGIEEARPFTDMLLQLRAKDGVVSVLGNHDFALYNRRLSDAQKEEKVEQLATYQRDVLGWKLLRNQSFTIARGNDTLQIIGVDNASCKGQGFRTIYRADLPKAMQTLASSPSRLIASSPFKILLSHDPSHWRAEVLPNTDIPLTLSGHTHAGQMRIFGYPLSSLMFKESDGWYEKDGQSLYINTGIGCTLPVRVGVPAEITMITLKKSQ